jgi:hypothetical protein
MCTKSRVSLVTKRHVARFGYLKWLDNDAADLAGRPTPAKELDKQDGKPRDVVVPDTPYDPALWLGADEVIAE